MTLLKNDSSMPERLQSVSIKAWPISIRDGWLFGIGFELAMTIAIPLILVLLSCLVGIGVTILGTSLGSLLGG